MIDRRIRWGVLGTANIGRVRVIPAIQHSNNGELVAVASRDSQKARDFASTNNIPTSYGSYESLISASNVDAIYIPLPNSLHREWAIKAAEAGKHVLCEKPLAMNAAECIEMETAARSNNVKLMEAFMYRFHPQIEKMLELVKTGKIGDLRLIHSAFTFRVTRPNNIRLQPELGGGSLMDVGCYCVNINRTIAAQEPVEVQAYAKWGATGVDEQMTCSLRFSNGILAQFDCALTLDRREFCQLVGTTGVLDVPLAFLPGTEDTTIRQQQGQNVVLHKIHGVDEYRLMVEYFANCVLKDQTPRYPPSEAAANMRVIEALYRSARDNGKPMPVPQS
ncbi:MAG TPA: Gfo/Idh/MocA family oxidoreductase [Candidatus Bathyarchaeia archaeon]|nr:Gfo/Idh/MocA family oxidoreductase [Candidatus Bathyarchaeia archaeon]